MQSRLAVPSSPKPVEYIVGGATERGSCWPEQNPSIVRPFKEFRAFQHVALAPSEKNGHSHRARFETRVLDEKVHQFVVKPGNYDILIGSASDSGYEYRSIRYDDREFACLLINGRDTCALPR